MDALSDVLSLLKVRSYMSSGFDAGGDWSIQFGAHDGFKFHAVEHGDCLVCVEGIPDPVKVSAGDCFLLPRGLPFRVTNNLALTPVDAHTICPPACRGGITTYNGGGDFLGISAYFALTGDDDGLLLGALPPIVHIHKESDKALLRYCVERMRQELREPLPGGLMVAQHLAIMVLVLVLRLHLSEQLCGRVGWLFALADKQMSVAINAMHARPAHRWTLQAIAEHAGMSRTAFAVKFKEKVGISPMEYLTRWRMRLGADRLMNSADPISVIALSLGYESESAFSTAFKRVMGCSPRQYGREQMKDMLFNRELDVVRANNLPSFVG
jgi:AraC-like DNA-binding protein